MFSINTAIHHSQLKMETEFGREEWEEGRGHGIVRMEKAPSTSTPPPREEHCPEQGGRKQPHPWSFPC